MDPKKWRQVSIIIDRLLKSFLVFYMQSISTRQRRKFQDNLRGNWHR